MKKRKLGRTRKIKGLSQSRMAAERIRIFIERMRTRHSKKRVYEESMPKSKPRKATPTADV